MGDYEHELLPPLRDLLGGDVSSFAQHAPIYGASAWPRLPFAWLADSLGAGDLGVYRAGDAGLPAAARRSDLLARAPDAGRAARPPTSRPRSPSCCSRLRWHCARCATGIRRTSSPRRSPSAAVLLALRSRAPLAGIALGLAVAFKPWAVIAAGPVLVAARERRLHDLPLAAGAAVLAWGPLPLLAHRSRGQSDVNALTLSARIFHPQQLLWPLGERHANGGVVAPDGLDRPRAPGDRRSAPFALSLLWAWRRRAHGAPRARTRSLLLALILLARCSIDPWNNAYYAVPAVISLGAWEALTRRGIPVASTVVLVFTWLSFVRLPMYLEPDGLALAYALWIVPALALLALRLYAPSLMSSATAARTSSEVELGAVAHVARRLTDDERDALADALLVEAHRLEHGVRIDAVEAQRQTGRAEQFGGLFAQRVGARQAQRGEQAEADGLAVQQQPVAGDGLDRVADRVAEVEYLAAAAVTLVGGDDLELRARALEDHVLVGRAARGHPLPERAARDQRRLHDLGVAGRELPRGQRRQQ